MTQSFLWIAVIKHWVACQLLKRRAFHIKKKKSTFSRSPWKTRRAGNAGRACTLCIILLRLTKLPRAMTSEFLPRCFSTHCTAWEHWNPQCLILPDRDGWTSYRREDQTWVGFKHPSFLTSALKDPTAPLFSFSLLFVLQTHSNFHRSPSACWFDFLRTPQVMNISLPQLFQTESTLWVHLDWLHGCRSRLEGACLGYLQDPESG